MPCDRLSAVNDERYFLPVCSRRTGSLQRFFKVEAGRVYERFALQARTLGIRTAFINQLVAVRRLRPQLNSLLGR